MSRTRKGWLIGLAALNLALFVVVATLVVMRGPGGGAEADAEATSPSPTASGAPAEPEGQEPEPPATPSDAAPDPEPTDDAELEPVPEGAVELAAFRLPSGNISCTMGTPAAACSIGEFSFTPPPGDACEEGESRGGYVELTDGGVNVPCLMSVPGVDAGAPVLDYGQVSAVGSWVCSSTQSGVECRSRLDGAGFTLSRGSFTSF